MPDSMSISEHVYLHMEWLPSRLGVFSSIFGLHSRLCSLLQDSYLGFGYQGREPRNPNSQKEIEMPLAFCARAQPMSAELVGQSARAFLPFLPNSDLECFEDQSRVPECLLASSFMELIEFFESAHKQPGPVHAHAQGLDGTVSSICVSSSASRLEAHN
ncbi:uncharacterized [Tachysurus ichikawai]